MGRDITNRDESSRYMGRRAVLGGIGAMSTAGLITLAGCTTEDSSDSGTTDGSDGGGDGPDALIVIGYPASGVQLFSDYYAEYDTDTSILITDGMKSETLPDDVGEDLSNISGTAPAASGPGADFFAQRYNEAYGTEPGVFTAHTYDATAILVLANVAAGSNDGPAIRDAMRSVANPDGEEFGPDSFVEAVETVASGTAINYNGASSAVNFDENGDMGAVKYDIFSYGSDGLSTDDTIPFEGGSDGGGGSDSIPGSDSDRTVKVGSLMATSGDLADLGKPMSDAGTLPVKQLEGNVDLTIDQRVADSQTDPQAGISAANNLVNAGYQAIAGPLSSGVNLKVANQVYIPNKVVGCSPSSTSPKVTPLDDSDFIFRTAPSDALQGKVLAQVAAEDKGATTAATMYVNNSYGQSLSESFVSAFEEAGGTVQAEVAFEKEQSSYSAKLQSAMSQ